MSYMKMHLEQICADGLIARRISSSHLGRRRAASAFVYIPRQRFSKSELLQKNIGDALQSNDLKELLKVIVLTPRVLAVDIGEAFRRECPPGEGFSRR